MLRGVLFQALSFLSLLSIKGQRIDKLANIPSKIENKKEIRIYCDKGITNSGEIFRVYQNQDKIWKAELIQWFLPQNISNDEFVLTPPKVIQLESLTPIDKLFLNLEALNIGYLPKEEVFDYKKATRKVVYDKDEKENVIETKTKSVLDGRSFSVHYRSGEKENEFHYSNPSGYLKEYPDINEYESFIKILKYIENNFNIKLDQ
ncbi:hypothetical protein [Elizabethkingia meningoseptica]|uniref:hypothetical protein n=1 Tax=Elizabethkingia meningoseptica TaxID=238 RepID=UPI00389183CD